MSSTAKRLDLRFGAFACSVQGFDDPVAPVQQVLRAIQHLLEETPELGDSAINFDVEAIEQLVGEVARRADLDERQVEIVPGLVIVHHGAGGDLDAPLDAPAGDAEAPAGADGYVNIFSPAAYADSEGDDDPAPWPAPSDEGARDATAEDRLADDRLAGPETAEDETAEDEIGEDESEDLMARLRRVAESEGGDEAMGDSSETDAAEDGIDRRAGWDRSDAAEAPDAPDAEESTNLFASAPEEDPAAEGGPTISRSLFSVVADESDDAPEPARRERLRLLGLDADEDAAAEDEEAAPAEEGYTAADLAARAQLNTVPELMVAAAAWMVLIQGRTQFTRRDVLEVFDSIPGDHERTPEARIKGFGKAMRNGHLVMIEEGVYGLARADLEHFQRCL